MRKELIASQLLPYVCALLMRVDRQFMPNYVHIPTLK